MIIKGNFIDTPTKDSFRVREGGYLIVEEGKVREYRREAPRDLDDRTFLDYSDHLIIPSFCDMHLHAPQFLQRGLGMDRELIGWLENYTFPREAHFADPDWARTAYEPFVEALYRAGSLRSCIFATVHREGALILSELLEEKGLAACVGKVNMDSNAPDYIREGERESFEETLRFVDQMDRYEKIRPIVTPRFVPSCSGGLLRSLGRLAEERDLPVQSHLCETVKEVAWVKELFPQAESYSHVYEEAGLLRPGKSLMAHGIHMSPADLESVQRRGTVLVHCPDSNLNLTSGIMDVTGLEEKGIPLCLGSDVGGGHELPMNRVLVSAVQSSKTRHRLTGSGSILTHEEAFYMATAGGRFVWENSGSFEEGRSFDALVVKDPHSDRETIPLLDRLYRFFYTGDDRDIVQRILEGKLI
ncbi:MAG: amidohydrolase family protein [Spirochaetales bacterium]|nr:amidohydrolase family protein [Spirochaetales bacterium]